MCDNRTLFYQNWNLINAPLRLIRLLYFTGKWRNTNCVTGVVAEISGDNQLSVPPLVCPPYIQEILFWGRPDVGPAAGRKFWVILSVTRGDASKMVRFGVQNLALKKYTCLSPPLIFTRFGPNGGTDSWLSPDRAFQKCNFESRYDHFHWQMQLKKPFHELEPLEYYVSVLWQFVTNESACDRIQ